MSNAEPSQPGNGSAERRLLDPVDTLLAAFLIASCVYFVYLSNQLPEPASFLGDNVLPGHFPRLMLYTIAILALLVPFEHRFSPESWPSIRKSRRAPIGLNTCLTAVFMAVILALGPVIGTVLMVLGTALLLPIIWGERRYLLVIVFSVLFTAIITYLFSIVLSVYFEPGIFNITLR